MKSKYNTEAAVAELHNATPSGKTVGIATGGMVYRFSPEGEIEARCCGIFQVIFYEP